MTTSTNNNNVYELQIEDAELSFEDIIQADNIAELLSKRQLQEIASNCTTKMEVDDGSRADWLDVMDAVDDLMKIDFRERTFPWRGASNAKYPMILDAVIKVASRLYTDIVKGDKICKSRVIGPDLDGTKAQRSDRVDAHMNWQIMGDSESDWDENTDHLFQKLITYGTVFRKISHNPTTGKRIFETIDPSDCIVNNSNSVLDHDTIISQKHIFTSNDIESRIRTKTFIDYDYQSASDSNGADIDPDGSLIEYDFIEQHTLIDLDNDGYAEPYIVYVDTQSNMVVRIVKNFNPLDVVFNEDDEIVMIPKIDHYVVYRTGFNIDGSFYHYGLGSLLHNINDSINKLLRQQIDVASLQARQGMIFAKGARVRGGNRTVRLNENIIIDTAPGEKLRDNVMEYPVNPPSPVVLQLFEMLIGIGTKISGLTDIANINNQSSINNIPATTMLAMIEQGLKNYSALYKRVYRSMTKEFAILYRLNREFTDEAEYINVLDDVQAIYQADYEDEQIDVIPNADPTISSDTQRIMRLQALLEIKDDPQVNDRAILEEYIKILGQDVEKVLPPLDPDPPMTPELIHMDNSMRVAAEQINLEFRKLYQKDIELQMESQKIAADIQLKETEALLKIAQAESEERGRQLDEYKAVLEGFKQMMEVTPMLEDISTQRASMDVTETIPLDDIDLGDDGEMEE